MKKILSKLKCGDYASLGKVEPYGSLALYKGSAGRGSTFYWRVGHQGKSLRFAIGKYDPSAKPSVGYPTQGGFSRCAAYHAASKMSQRHARYKEQPGYSLDEIVRDVLTELIPKAGVTAQVVFPVAPQSPRATVSAGQDDAATEADTTPPCVPAATLITSAQLATLLNVPHQVLLRVARQFGEAENISPASMGFVSEGGIEPCYHFMSERGRQISLELAKRLAPGEIKHIQALWNADAPKSPDLEPNQAASSTPLSTVSPSNSPNAGSRVYVTSGEIARLTGKEHYHVNRWVNRLTARGLIQPTLRVPVPAKNNTMVVSVFSGTQGEQDSLTLVRETASEATQDLRLLWAQRKVIAWDMLKQSATPLRYND